MIKATKAAGACALALSLAVLAGGAVRADEPSEGRVETENNPLPARHVEPLVDYTYPGDVPVRAQIVPHESNDAGTIVSTLKVDGPSQDMLPDAYEDMWIRLGWLNED